MEEVTPSTSLMTVPSNIQLAHGQSSLSGKQVVVLSSFDQYKGDSIAISGIELVHTAITTSLSRTQRILGSGLSICVPLRCW